VGCWRGYLSGARCRFAYGPADATATHSLATVNPDWFYLFGTGLPNVIPEKNPESRKMVIVVVVVVVSGSGNSERET